MGVTSLFRRLLGFVQTVVCGVHFEDIGLVIDVRPRWRNPRCGLCGRPGPGYDTSRSPRLWRHLPLGRIQFWLRYTLRRVECGSCGVKVERVPWAALEARFTSDLEELVAYLAQRMDKTAITKQLGIAWRSVGAVVGRVIAHRLDPERLNNLSVIGVDELSYRRNHQYVTVVVDHLRRRVVWVGEGKSAESLERFFTALGPERARKLTHVTMDMSAAYIDAVTRHAPHAQKVFDRFHVQKLANDAVDEVRREETHHVEDGRAIKRSRWALLKNPWNLTQRQTEKLSEVQRNNRRLYRAYLLKESLARALDYRQHARAKRHLTAWIAWAKRSKLKPFARLAKTIKRYCDGILAYVSTRFTNGLTEGLNNKTRLITRRAYGFHGSGALASLIYLCCGGIVLNPPLPSPI